MYEHLIAGIDVSEFDGRISRILPRDKATLKSALTQVNRAIRGEYRPMLLSQKHLNISAESLNKFVETFCPTNETPEDVVAKHQGCVLFIMFEERHTGSGLLPSLRILQLAPGFRATFEPTSECYYGIEPETCATDLATILLKWSGCSNAIH